MSLSSRIWIVTTALFTLGNAVGGGYALAEGELVHAGTHFVLMLVGTYAVWRLATRRAPVVAPLHPADDRLEQLQQSLDVVAVEIERLGEAQRFNARQQAERVEQRS